ncbi:MAG: MBL fold metallo-hydrolase [Ruminococcaceae bacterium]|nr:MBL fold metallo-hydrolase [Oscillospiraceae bacterium]
MSGFYTLFSGSSGNCTFISDGRTNLLVDAGVSAARIAEALAKIGIHPSEIHGILVTHEHRDHILGVGTLSRNYSIPVYATSATMEKAMTVTGWIFDDNIHVFNANEKFGVGDIEVFSFSTSHDAVDSVGYTFRFGGNYYSVATDMGCVTDVVLKHLCKSKAVLIESNHDVEMLKNGPYPYHLKQRILGRRGHLSNEHASLLAAQLVKWGAENIVLGHLSEKNNTPDIAYNTTAECFAANDIKIGKDVNLTVAPADGICHIV